MARNTGCENSDGCSAAVLERMVLDPRLRRKDTGTGSLLPWFSRERDHVQFPAGSDQPVISDESGIYPVFLVSGWKFTVKTRDLQLIADLKSHIGEISHYPRADLKFTFRLVRCTEQGRLAGWAWQKERLPIGSED